MDEACESLADPAKSSRKSRKTESTTIVNVENDVGKVWCGTYKNYSGRPWNFGQFEDSVLPACCFILDKSRLKPAERGNPARRTRKD